MIITILHGRNGNSEMDKNNIFHRKTVHRCFRQGNMPFRQAHCLLLICCYTKAFEYKDTIGIHLETFVDVFIVYSQEMIKETMKVKRGEVKYL